MITLTMQSNLDEKYLSGRASKMEKALAWEILKDTTPFVPALTGSLTLRSYVRGSDIVYPGPYARYLWYGNVMVNAATGKGPMFIPGVGYRWPKGAILKPTARPLKFNTSVHPDAQARWMEASKHRNMEKWKKLAARIYTDG